MGQVVIPHECQYGYIWHMHEHQFSWACWDCRYGGSTYPSWAENVRISNAMYYRMMKAMAKGYEVDTDGTDFIATKDGRSTFLWLVLTDEEWREGDEYRGERRPTRGYPGSR